MAENQDDRRGSDSKIATMVKKYEQFRIDGVIKGKTISLMDEGMQSKIRKDEEIVMRFLSQWDIPHWFRGISQAQLTAGSRLFHSLRDDTEQQTTYRVEACLKEIGIEPLVDAEAIYSVMRVARKNDLAFLWFLWEAYYKTPGPWYTVNEQIIYSIIAHLDMIPTFRELDRILPPGPQPKKQKSQLKTFSQREPRTKRPFTTSLSHNLEGFGVPVSPGNNLLKMPYFQKQTVPHPIETKNYVSTPGLKVSFKSYEKYRDPYYVVPNESSRWYADYNLDPNKHMALNIISDELRSIFESFSEKIVDFEIGRIIKTINHSIGNQKSIVEVQRSLCAHHKYQEEVAKRLKLEATVKEKDRCIMYLNTYELRREKRRQEIANQLEKEVDSCMRRNRNITKFTKSKGKSHIMVMKVDSVCDIHSVSSTYGGNEIDSAGKPKCVLNRKSKEHHTDQYDAEFNGKRRDSKHLQCFTCRGNYEGKMRTTTKCAEHQRSDHYISDWDQESRIGIDEKPAAPLVKYFEAPDENRPYQFNYPTIFSFEDNDELSIQGIFEKSLVDDVELPKRPKDVKRNIDEAVKICTKKIWREGVAKKNQELKAKEEEVFRRAVIKRSKKKTPLNYEEERFDPDNRDLMNNLLKDALDYMKRNPKYVLASLPDVHKMPILQEFIKARYGKTYSMQERSESYSSAANIFVALSKLLVTRPQPNTRKFGTQTLGTYGCRQYYLGKMKWFMKDYYEKLDDCIMELTRILWLAMRPRLCSNGPPRNTFFAYMPAKVSDIKHFRPWKKFEFRAVAQARLIRNIKNIESGGN